MKQHKPWCINLGLITIHNKEQWDIELVTIDPQPNLIPLFCVHFHWFGYCKRLFGVFA